MGVCQSYFGASTSGQGLTASQLAACIRAAARHGATAPTTDENGTKLPLTGPDANQTFTIDCKVDGGKTTTNLLITSFAANAFRNMRLLEQIDDKFFEDEWVLPEDHAGLRETEGRSRAMFLVSNHRCLLCKTVSEGEVNVLLQMLPNLSEHLHQHPHSLLQRFVLALKIEDVGTKEIGWVVVFTDIFAKCDVINEKWDLKGRQPKAAKYLFFPQQQEGGDAGDVGSASASSSAAASSSSPPQDQTQQQKQQQALNDDDDVNTDESTQSHGNLAQPTNDPSMEDVDRAHTKTYGDGYNRVIARKDKELTRVFFISGAPLHAELQAIIKIDADFLAKSGILDYSVLIGVRYADPDSPNRAMRYNELYYNPQNDGPSKIAGETRDTCDGVQLVAQSKFHRGIDASQKHERYFVGIIDMLTSYGFAKKSANFFKNCLWTDVTLSTIPPESYKDRIVDFMKRCIVAGPE